MIHQYTTTRQDFLAAQRLVRGSNRRRRSAYIFFIWIVPALAIPAFAFLLKDVLIDHFSFPSWAGGVLAMISFLGFYFPLAYQLQLRRLYEQMKNGREEGSPLELELTGDELISRVPGLSEGRFKRAALSGYREDDAVALLYFSKKRFLLLPKRAMDAAGWTELRAWLGPDPARRPS